MLALAVVQMLVVGYLLYYIKNRAGELGDSQGLYK